MRTDLLARLACPLCRDAGLRLERARLDGSEITAGEIVCERCGTGFAIEDGIPVLIAPALRGHVGEHADLEVRHKRQQMAFYDARGTSDFEVTRPWGRGRVYDFLIRHKFQPAIAPIAPGPA